MSRKMILLTDPCEVMRIGFRNVISEMKLDFQFDECFSEEEIEFCTAQNPGCIVMINLASGGYKSYRMATELARRQTDIKLMLISAAENPFLSHLLVLGAKCVLGPAATKEEIQEATRSLLLGDFYCDSQLKVPSTPINISEKEFRVVQFLIQGKTSREIGSLMDKNIKTIETYRYRLFKKTGVRNMAELVYLFTRNNMYDKNYPAVA